MKDKINWLIASSAIFLSMIVTASAEMKERISIVGSSTVYPFTTVVAERFAKKGFKTPIVESTGTGGGMKLFCSSVGEDSPDFTNASRAIKSGEIEACKKSGVTPIEIKVGIDGIVVANSISSKQMKISIDQLYLALVSKVKVDGKFIDNPYDKWSDIDKSLPAKKIEVFGPPPSSGTRDAFISLVMKKGAKSLGITDEKIYKSIREDGHFIETGENDNIIIQKLVTNKNAYGIFGYGYLEENQSKLQGSIINGVKPTYENLVTFDYPLARYLYVYAKKEHIGKTKGMKEFIKEFVSKSAVGRRGYLARKGLVPLNKKEKKEMMKILKPLLS